MDTQKQAEPVPLLGWHNIHGAPYFLREEEKDRFCIVKCTSTILYNGKYSLYSDLERNIHDLVLGEDIEEFTPDNIHMGILVDTNSRLDFQVVRGLRHLAILENALYVAFQGIEGCYAEPVPFFKRDLVLPRFFNRKYDTGSDLHIV